MSTTRALEHAIQHVKNGSTIELTTDDVLSMWGLVRVARLSELERENARMRAALEDIAKQVPAKDMDEDYYEAADFEDGYDRCVFQARAALAGSVEK
jgi:hypothetical protein